MFVVIYCTGFVFSPRCHLSCSFLYWSRMHVVFIKCTEQHILNVQVIRDVVSPVYTLILFTSSSCVQRQVLLVEKKSYVQLLSDNSVRFCESGVLYLFLCLIEASKEVNLVCDLLCAAFFVHVQKIFFFRYNWTGFS